MIVVCVPLYNRGADITYLLGRIKEILDGNPADVSVNIGDYSSTDVDLEHLKEKFDYKINIIDIEGKFSRAGGLHYSSMRAVERSDPDTIIFHCDADMHLPDDIFTKIKQHTKNGETFYVPIYGFECVDGEVEFYEHGGKGNLSLYSGDYRRFVAGGGYGDMVFKTTWGEEDHYIYENLIKILDPVRIPEPGFYSRWHKREQSDWYSSKMINKYSDPNTPKHAGGKRWWVGC